MKTSASVGGVGGGGRRGGKEAEREREGIHANVSFVAPTRLVVVLLVFLPNLSIPFFPRKFAFHGKKPHYRKV